jgi:hypothetical protein
MTRPMTTHKAPAAIVSSTVGTTLISIAAVWLVTTHAFAPPVATTDTVRIEHAKSATASDRPLYRLSPVPAGADWTS